MVDNESVNLIENLKLPEPPQSKMDAYFDTVEIGVDKIINIIGEVVEFVFRWLIAIAAFPIYLIGLGNKEE